jgi:hypothetical protein
MSSFQTLTQLARDTPDPGSSDTGPFSAIIRTTATEGTDALMVELSLQPGVKRGPAIGWQARGETMPQDGDRCAVLELDDASWWIVAWWPAS